MDKVVVEFEVDRASLNKFLGNTPNVNTASALSEFLGGLFSGIDSCCDGCGSCTYEVTHVKGGFKIIK